MSILLNCKKNIKNIIIFNSILFLVTLNVFEVAQVLIVEGSTSFGYNTFFNNLWWFNYFFGIMVLLILPQGILLIKYLLKFSKYLFTKLQIKKIKLKIQNSISIFLLIIFINIIVLVKIIHILNFDFLNYLNFSFIFFKEFELFNYIYLLNLKLFSNDVVPMLIKNITNSYLTNNNVSMVDCLNLIENNKLFNLEYISTFSYFIKYNIIEIIDFGYLKIKTDFDWNSFGGIKIKKLYEELEIDFFKYGNYNNFYYLNNFEIKIFKDGLTFWLLWLVSLVFFVISFGTNKKLYKKNIIFENFHVYNHLLVLILFLMVICFSIKNILIFFISFETILIPLFLHIMFQGSRLNKIQAIKYLVMYTLIGSAFLWYSISYFIEISGSTDFDQLRWVLMEFSTVGSRRLLFIFLFLGFAFKVPLVPFHHWLIIAHVEAPTNGSIILAALLLKVGGYGLYRFVYTIFPMESLYFSNEILVVSLFGYTFATILAIRQVDLKRYIAYTSIAHMNFSLLGLFSTYNVGILGYIHLMISHGIIASAMFFLVGYIYNILNFRDTVRLSGLAYNFPKFSVFFFIFSMANMGLPLFSGFPGEFFILISILSNNVYFGFFIFFGFIFSGVYNFFQLNKVLFSTSMNLLNLKKKDDLNSSSILIISVLLYWSLVFGILPDIITQNVEIFI